LTGPLQSGTKKPGVYDTGLNFSYETNPSFRNNGFTKISWIELRAIAVIIPSNGIKILLQFNESRYE
jgi:hypothetical protein